MACSGLVLAGALSLGGCYARARVEPAYVETTYVPARVDVYPSYRYEGRVVYLIDNRWYYRHSNGRWVYYREEPQVLYQRRMALRQAPPAPRRIAPEPYRPPPSRPAPPAYYREDGRVPPPPPKKHKRHDDRDYRDDDDRDRDGRRHDDHDRDGRRHDDRDHDYDRGRY